MPEITFDLSDGRDAVDVRWGTQYPCQLAHIKLHPNNTRSSRAPWILYIHGGGASLNDGRLPFIANGNGNFLFDRALNQTDLPNFNCISVTLPQHEFPFDDATWPFLRSDSLGNGHSQTDSNGAGVPFWTKPRQGEYQSFPSLFHQLKVFLCWWKSVCEQYGCDPGRGVIIGSSFGGHRAMLSQITKPLYSTDLMHGAALGQFHGMLPGVDSRVRGVINHYGIVDVRKDPQYVVDHGDPAGTYIFFPFYIGRYAGVRTKEQLDALPAYVTEQMSWLWYIEQGLTDYLVPHYQLWERNGFANSGTNPVGTVTYPCPDPSGHAEQFLFIAEQVCAENGLEHINRSTLINPADILDTSGVDPRDEDGRTFQQIAADDILGWAAECCSGQQGGQNVRSGHSPIYWGEDDYS